MVLLDCNASARNDVPFQMHQFPPSVSALRALESCMKRFTVPCDFNGVKHPFHVYIGDPHPKKHPLQFQSWWLSSERGGNIPQDVMDSFEKLFKISQENNVSFEDLCVYALGAAQQEQATASA